MKKLFLSCMLLLCVSCQSSPLKDFQKISVGATKAYVLSEIGGPQRTFRRNSVDHWVYVFSGPKGERIEREIQFTQGKVVRIGAMGEPQENDFEPLN